MDETTTLDSIKADMRRRRLQLTKAQLVDIIASMEEDSDSNQELLNEFWDKVPFDNNQQLFEAFLWWSRNDSWDIPSALMSVCGHNITETNDGDFYMHRSEYWPDNEWSPIDEHFRTVHGLDLASPSIDWSFST